MSTRLLGLFALLLLALAAGVWWLADETPPARSVQETIALSERDALPEMRLLGGATGTTPDAGSIRPGRTPAPVPVDVVPLALDGGLSVNNATISSDLKLITLTASGNVTLGTTKVTADAATWWVPAATTISTPTWCATSTAR